MLIICENHHGDTSSTAIPYNHTRRSDDGNPRYIRYNGNSRLPAGVYMQRYLFMAQLPQRYSGYAALQLEVNDLVQEAANADHPGDRSERRAT